MCLDPPLVRAVKSFGFCAGLGFRARFFVRVPSCRRRPVAGPPRSCPRPARRGRPRASSRSSSCAPATSPLPPHSSARNACLPRTLAPPLALFRLASLPRSRSCCASPASALSHDLDLCYAPLPPTLSWLRPPIPPRSCSLLPSAPAFLPSSLPKIVTEQY